MHEDGPNEDWAEIFPNRQNISWLSNERKPIEKNHRTVALNVCKNDFYQMIKFRLREPKLQKLGVSQGKEMKVLQSRGPLTT